VESGPIAGTPMSRLRFCGHSKGTWTKATNSTGHFGVLKKFKEVKKMKGKKNKNNKKICPFLDCECLEAGCMLYHEEFGRCFIDILLYNIYCLMTELKKLNARKE
jgi:hypothetical protein